MEIMIVDLRESEDILMKKLTTFFVVFFCLVLLVGCNKAKEEINTPTNTPSDLEDREEIVTNNTINAENNPFNFTHFSLDVKYANSQKYEAEFKNEPSAVEAEVEDTIHNEHLKGNAAYEKLEPYLKSLTFDSSTQDSAVITEVLKAFGLPEDYAEFDLEVRFNDGNNKEYKMKM